MSRYNCSGLEHVLLSACFFSRTGHFEGQNGGEVLEGGQEIAGTEGMQTSMRGIK